MNDLGPLFVPPHEPDRLGMLIAGIAGVVIVVAAIALVRGRLPDAFSSTVMLLVPVFTYMLGNVNLLEQSKRVDFCGSCHETMSPIIAAMKSDIPYLASIHYRSGAVPREYACYRCHGGYGFWGDAKAKYAGVTHMVHTVLGTYAFPLKKVGAFDIASCLDCHAQAAPFREQETHRDPGLQEALLKGEMGCAGVCHPAPHPPGALEGAVAWEASR